MNKKTIYEYLSSAGNGNPIAKDRLCKLFYDDHELAQKLPEDFWKKVEGMANTGEDFANFIMHCRYFDDPGQSSLSYDYIRKAIRHKEIPLAVLRLGISYSLGIGTKVNHVLSNYFYEMAYTLGCQEAEDIIEQEFEFGRRNIADAIERAIGNNGALSPQQMARLGKLLERERKKKNYGLLTNIRDYLPVFYPDYDEEKAFGDVLNKRDTVDADICYSLSTSNNQSEFNLDILESMLQQLYAPITQDKNLVQGIIECGENGMLGKNEKELLQCIVNLSFSYGQICNNFGIKNKEIINVEPTEIYPYFKAPILAFLRKQAFRCVLTIRGINTEIMDQYLYHLNSDEELLSICEDVTDKDLQLFLISFVEINLEIDTQEKNYQDLLNSYRDHQWDALACHLNEFVKRLNDAGIKHHLPRFTPDNLPPIQIR